MRLKCRIIFSSFDRNTLHRLCGNGKGEQRNVEVVKQVITRKVSLRSDP